MSDAPWFDHESWLHRFRSAEKTHDHDAIRSLRVAVMESTLAVLAKKRYQYHDGTPVTLPDYPAASFQITAVMMSSSPTRGHHTTTDLYAEEEDCLVVHHRLVSEGYRPCVLNMASAKRPGGGYLTGAGAQEENLFRRSSYSQQLLAGWYPLGKAVMYTPNVVVFRDTEKKGYALLPITYPTCFVACAAKSQPLMESATRMRKEEAESLEHSVRVMLSAAAGFGHDSLVLSALGCGAYANPPDHVAAIFHRVLTGPQFSGVFRVVVFAIFDDHNAKKAHNPEGNFAPFAKVFGVKKKDVGTVAPPPPLLAPPDFDQPFLFMKK